MRITCLVENTKEAGRSDLCAEHGLSLLLEGAGLRLLLDAGNTGIFVDNAAALGCDLSSVDVAVLSHHHYDHGNGLSRFLEINSSAKVILGRQEPADRYFSAYGVVKRSIGLHRPMLEKFAARFEPIRDEREISDGVVALTDIPSDYPLPQGNRFLLVEHDGVCVPDPFDHELVLVVREQDGLVVLTGCAHNGVLNMVDAAVRRFPEMPVKAVVGGFHLVGIPLIGGMVDSRHVVEGIGRRLLDLQVRKVYTGHCTGGKAFRVLQGMLGDRLEHLSTGAVLEV